MDSQRGYFCPVVKIQKKISCLGKLKGTKYEIVKLLTLNIFELEALKL